MDAEAADPSRSQGQRDGQAASGSKPCLPRLLQPHDIMSLSHGALSDLGRPGGIDASMPILCDQFSHQQCFEDLRLFFDFLLFADLHFTDFLLLAEWHFTDLTLYADFLLFPDLHFLLLADLHFLLFLLFPDLHFGGDLGGQPSVSGMVGWQDEPCLAFSSAALNLSLIASCDPVPEPGWTARLTYPDMFIIFTPSRELRK